MEYRTVRIKERIVFVPDRELKELLRFKLKQFRGQCFLPNLPVSVFGKKRGLQRFLPRHQNDRFFVTIDFVHAFHQVTREMMAQVLPKVQDSWFDPCFARLGGGPEVVPIGFCTSSYLFELLLAKQFDTRLWAWQNQYQGHVTRYADNVLVTWMKGVPEAFAALKKTFAGVQIRMTPRNPRKWMDDNPIRFCGVTLSRSGPPRLSRTKKAVLLAEAAGKSLWSWYGVWKYIQQFEASYL